MIKYNPKSIGHLLKEKKLSQSQLARQIKVSRQLVFNWLAFGQQPQADKLMTIAAIFNLPMTYFFTTDYAYSRTTGEKQKRI
jgi:transcriptional regulator with XRE-family HTH domain